MDGDYRGMLVRQLRHIEREAKTWPRWMRQSTPAASAGESEADQDLRELMYETFQVMKPGFMPVWWTSPLPGLGGLSPLAAWESGRRDEVCRIVHLLGSGEPV